MDKFIRLEMMGRCWETQLEPNISRKTRRQYRRGRWGDMVLNVPCDDGTIDTLIPLGKLERDNTFIVMYSHSSKPDGDTYNRLVQHLYPTRPPVRTS